ncbi:NAD(P)/FAD-dependent oxidoreductase [Bacillus luteolus]|uniref:NAD(P)/FAD-dependent oxidoreductase n=1 Tax=Litchfieldia luteola TaxID=682179 RepID=A0ABR9QNL6_9BACI|nr:NAD(P)/FAD-dependent oxidoreductase [Cytobacillus luteolus]MBE4910095.1 NAD(P)/FAD-dependent oxidoreductase [Cytobacillus luteolus]MBP1942341.1 thioredoxin reductase [Cytobacillus luteolus]
MAKVFDCIIIGGGFAGLQAAIQLGRYNHTILVIDSNHGRSTICKSYHNILGYPDGVSGGTLRSLGKLQAESYGVEFVEDEVTDAEKTTNNFILRGKSGETYEAKKILLATGVMDRIPDIPNIMPCLGLTIYVCPDCDGYEVKDEKVVLLGSGSTGANLALTLSYWTKQIVYINHDGRDLDEELKSNIQQKGITYIKQEIESVITGEKAHEFKGVKLKDGTTIEGDRGFIGFGGNKVKTDLAQKLGVERLENKHINVNPRTKETNIANVWAAGDILAHSEQVTIAMGDGSQAAIWIHKRILSEMK